MRKILFLSLACLILVSCSSVRGGNERPGWVDNPPLSSAFSTFIVGEGEGESEIEADEKAYRSLIDALSEKAGVDYSSKYDELTSTGTIADFGTEITGAYIEESDGVFHSYILSSSDSLLLEEVAARDYQALSEREERVKNKVDESLSYYRDNKDVKAIGSLLEAVEISLEGNIADENYQTDVLVARLEKYASQIEFDFVGRTKKTGGKLGFRIYRNKGIMHPSVEDAQVRIIYPSLNADGEVVYLPYEAMSDENGLICVNKTNAYSLKKGTMSISIYVDTDIIDRINKKAGEELLSRFRSLIEKAVLTALYSEEETYRSGDAIIALALYGYDGTRLDIETARKTIEEMCNLLEIGDVSVVEAEGEDEDEALAFLKETYPEPRVIYMLRIGIVDRICTLGTWYTKTEGKTVRIDNRKGTSEEYKTMQFSTASDGEHPDDWKALENQIRLTCGFVLGEF